MKVTVLGDLLLDIDVDGTATRLCPDAPVPVIDVSQETARAGGAGLVAMLLAADGHDVTLVTAMAVDAGAARLRQALPGVRLVSTTLSGATPTKTRLRANGVQVARVDSGCQNVRNAGATAAMISATGGAEAIVAADYGLGLLADPQLRSMLTSQARAMPVVWDPHPRGVVPVPGVAAVTPNLHEALMAAGVSGHTVAAAALAGRTLLQKWQSRALIVTMAERGALMLQDSPEHAGAPLLVPAPPLTGVDSCGAGDRFASALAVSLAGGQPISTAVEVAVEVTVAFLAAGGVSSGANRERASASNAAPAVTTGAADTSGLWEPDAVELATTVRARGGTVVATGGCFDVLHAGHIRMLAQARELGDCLIVLLNSDASVTAMKGSQRPIVTESDRKEVLRALASVDAVVVFNESTPEQTLRKLRPDIWVKGGDYSVETLPEARYIREWGGHAVTVPYLRQHSTTLLAQALARAGS